MVGGHKSPPKRPSTKRPLIKMEERERERERESHHGWLQNPFRSTLNPWLKPVLVGIFTGESNYSVGFLNACLFRNHPHRQLRGRGALGLPQGGRDRCEAVAAT